MKILIFYLIGKIQLYKEDENANYLLDSDDNSSKKSSKNHLKRVLNLQSQLKSLKKEK